MPAALNESKRQQFQIPQHRCRSQVHTKKAPRQKKQSALGTSVCLNVALLHLPFAARALVKSMAWERQATNKLPNDFDIQNAHACRSQVQKWQAGVAGATRVRAGRNMRDGAVFYAYCTSHQQCSFVWRHEFSTAEAGGKEHEVCSKGIHAEEPRKVRGTAVDVREQANALTQSNTPMQATVRLVEKGVDVEEWPSKADLTKARRRTTRQPDRGAEAGGGTTLGQWLEHLKEIDDAETPWQTIARADGCGVVMCQKFAEVT